MTAVAEMLERERERIAAALDATAEGARRATGAATRTPRLAG